VTTEYYITYNNNKIKFVYTYLLLDDSACNGNLEGLAVTVGHLLIHLLHFLLFLDMLEQHCVVAVDVKAASQNSQISINL
jgi:hypothetical protein